MLEMDFIGVQNVMAYPTLIQDSVNVGMNSGIFSQGLKY